MTLSFAPERPQDAPLAEALVERAFGPGRLVKSSERVREIATFAPELSVCAFEAGALVGTVRMWRVRIGGQPVVFLGPLAVDLDQRNGGMGALLVTRACDAAKAAGEAWVVLVGDEPYFARFGFAAAPAAGARLPGPVDQRRVLALRLAPDAPEPAGPFAPL